MKKLLALALPLIVLSVGAKAMSPDSLRTAFICEEGYKFMVVYSTTNGTSPSVVQIFGKGNVRADPPQPIRCIG